MVALRPQVSNRPAPQAELDAELDRHAQVVVAQHLEGVGVFAHVVLPAVFLREGQSTDALPAQDLTPFQHLLPKLLLDGEYLPVEGRAHQDLLRPLDDGGVVAVQDGLDLPGVDARPGDGLHQFLPLVVAGEEAAVGFLVDAAQGFLDRRQGLALFAPVGFAVRAPALGGVTQDGAEFGQGGFAIGGQAVGGVAAHRQPLLEKLAGRRAGGVGPGQEGLLVFVGQERQLAGALAQGVDLLEVQVPIDPGRVQNRDHRLNTGG